MPSSSRFRQAGFSVVLLALALSGILSACGKKPSEVDPPPGVTNDTFPKTYPDPSTDPKPTLP